MSTYWVRGALVCAVLVITSACQTTPTPPSPTLSPAASSTPIPTVTTPILTPTPTPSPIPSSAPMSTVQNFWATVDELRSATNAPPQVGKLTSYSRDPAARDLSSLLLQSYGRGEHQIGKTVIATASEKSGATATQVIVTLCLDTSKADVLGKDGKSVRSPDASLQNTAIHTVEQDVKDGRWYVVTYEGRRGC